MASANLNSKHSDVPGHVGSYRPIGRQQLRRLVVIVLGWLDDPSLDDSDAEQRAAGYLVGLSWGCRYQFRRQRRRAREKAWSAADARVEETD